MSEPDCASAIIVEIDSDLTPIVPEFLENRGKDCVSIERLLQEGGFAEIRTLAHRMKGAGGSYGFDEISELGEIIENASLEADRDTIRSALQRLVSYLEKVQVVYV